MWHEAHIPLYNLAAILKLITTILVRKDFLKELYSHYIPCFSATSDSYLLENYQIF